jgi:hypothetical protein
VKPPVAVTRRAATACGVYADAVLHPERGVPASAGRQRRVRGHREASDHVSLPRRRQPAVGVQERHDPQQAGRVRAARWGCLYPYNCLQPQNETQSVETQPTFQRNMSR